MNKKLFAIAFGVLAMFACKEPEPEPVVPQEPEYPEISLAAPEDGVEYDFNSMSQALSFGWNENEEINSYRLQFSLTPDFEVLENASAKKNPTEMGVLEMDEILGLLGLPEAKSAYVYWRVAPLRSDEFVCEPFSMYLTRLDPNTRVIAPADGMLFNLDEQKTSIAFEWRPAIGAQNHEVHFSLTEDFAKYESPYKLGAKDGRISLSPVALDEIAGKLGAEADVTCEIYWRVVPSAKDAEMEAYPARKIS
ncbi:MAG: SusE domain-containing protein, partial [Tidjanibacter sp.]|nr:SusE domain-containing protein [Tidjanibacter sp.]